MKKSIKRTSKGYAVHTVNGVNTKTGTVWTKQIREFKPLDNGFNLELANHVFDIISENQELWDQSSWRRLVLDWELVDDVEIDDDGKSRKDILAMMAFERDLTNPICGTAMCFAGWVGEVTGADYVVDSKVLRKTEDHDEITETELEYILVSKAALEGKPWSGKRWHEWDFTHEINKILKKRGFSAETHRLMPVSDYAEMMLGLEHGDVLSLFDGSNNLEGIREIIDLYAKNGPTGYPAYV